MFKNLLAVALLVGSSVAHADLFSFSPINNNNNNQAATVGDLFQLEVLDAGNNKVTFDFTNQNTLNTAIIAVYIGGPDVFSANTFAQSAGVDFNPINGQGQQPQSGFAVEASASSSNQGGSNFVNGIDEGGVEYLTYTLDLAQGSTFSSVIGSINSGDLLVGVTGQTNNQGNVEYLVDASVSAVPVPAALPLMASALGLFGIARRKK